jgi:hypothetical protein
LLNAFCTSCVGIGFYNCHDYLSLRWFHPMPERSSKVNISFNVGTALSSLNRLPAAIK